MINTQQKTFKRPRGRLSTSVLTSIEYLEKTLPIALNTINVHGPNYHMLMKKS